MSKFTEWIHSLPEVEQVKFQGILVAMQQEAVEQLNVCINELDWETGHKTADNLLLNLVDDLGFTEVVRTYNNVGKWYC